MSEVTDGARPRDHLDDVFDRYAVMDTCEYCNEWDVPCRPEPFGQKQACKTCWDQIIGGE